MLAVSMQKVSLAILDNEFPRAENQHQSGHQNEFLEILETRYHRNDIFHDSSSLSRDRDTRQRRAGRILHFELTDHLDHARRRDGFHVHFRLHICIQLRHDRLPTTGQIIRTLSNVAIGNVAHGFAHQSRRHFLEVRIRVGHQRDLIQVSAVGRESRAVFIRQQRRENRPVVRVVDVRGLTRCDVGRQLIVAFETVHRREVQKRQVVRRHVLRLDVILESLDGNRVARSQAHRATGIEVGRCPRVGRRHGRC